MEPTGRTRNFLTSLSMWLFGLPPPASPLSPAVSILYDSGHDLTHTLKKWKNNFLNLQ